RYAERYPHRAAVRGRPREMQARHRSAAHGAWNLHSADQLPDRSKGNGAAAHHADALSRRRTDLRVGRGAARGMGTARVAAQKPRAGGGVTAAEFERGGPTSANAGFGRRRGPVPVTLAPIFST